mgnify:CR=1 FL=1
MPFAFTGVSVAHPRLFDGSPDGAFSLNLVWSRAIAAGRAYGDAHGWRVDACRLAGRAGGSRAVPERCSSKLREREGPTAVRPARRIYTVPPGRPFLTALAEALLAGNLPVAGRARPGPMQLADTTLLLPTRRATRALQEAFLAAAGGARAAAAEDPAHHRLGRGPTLFTSASTCRRRRARFAPAIGEIERQLAAGRAGAALGGGRARRRGPEADIAAYRPTAARTAGAGGQAGARAGAADGRDGDRGRRLRADAGAGARHVCGSTGRRRSAFLRIVTERWPAHLPSRTPVSKMQRDKQLVLAQASSGARRRPTRR